MSKTANILHDCLSAHRAGDPAARHGMQQQLQMLCVGWVQEEALSQQQLLGCKG